MPGHRLGRRVLALFAARGDESAPLVGVGSTLLVPELLTKPTREGWLAESAKLEALLGRLELVPLDAATAGLAVALGATYRLRAADAVHLATAVASGGDRFITNNSRDFRRTITEIDVTYPADLPDPAELRHRPGLRLREVRLRLAPRRPRER